jgi:hypothetical protein
MTSFPYFLEQLLKVDALIILIFLDEKTEEQRGYEYFQGPQS